MKIFAFLISLVTLFINNFPEFVDRLFKKIPEQLQKPLALVNDIVNKLKTFVDSPVADFITAAIAGTTDDEVKEWLRVNLPKVLAALEVIKNGKIVLPEDETARALKLLNLNAYLTKEITATPTDQAAITAAVYYRGSATA